MNAKAKAAFLAAMTVIIGFTVFWASLSTHSFAAAPPAVERYKVIYGKNSGENLEDNLTRLPPRDGISRHHLANKSCC